MREHGTYVRYVTDRCRCDLCKQAHSDSERALDEIDNLRAWVAVWRAAVVALDALMAKPDHATREALDQWRSITRAILARYPEEGTDE